jgi:nicotinamide riboside kinase
LKNKPKSIVVTGAESTGKSALCEWLARYYGVPYLPEFARKYVENLGRRYDYTDIETIARMQVQQFNELKSRSHTVFFADTWLIITKIWFEEVFQKVPAWVEMEIQQAEIDLFLVCDTDLPWIPDHVRENGGEKREYLQNRYIECIRNYGFNYEIIKGKNSSRNYNAVRCLEQNNILKPKQA